MNSIGKVFPLLNASLVVDRLLVICAVDQGSGLEDLSTSLLGLSNVYIPPQQDACEGQRHEASTRDNHMPLYVSVRADNRLPCVAPPLVLQLNRQRPINRHHILLLLRWEVLPQILRKLIRPDTARDRAADGPAHVGRQRYEREHDGYLVVRDDGHNSELLADDDGSGRDGLEDLTHDDVADVGVRGAEVDEEAGGEAGDGDRGQGDPLEVVCLADEAVSTMLVKSYWRQWHGSRDANRGWDKTHNPTMGPQVQEAMV